MGRVPDQEVEPTMGTAPWVGDSDGLMGQMLGTGYNYICLCLLTVQM